VTNGLRIFQRSTIRYMAQFVTKISVTLDIIIVTPTPFVLTNVTGIHVTVLKALSATDTRASKNVTKTSVLKIHVPIMPIAPISVKDFNVRATTDTIWKQPDTVTVLKKKYKIEIDHTV